MRKTALVLGSGGARGYAHLGVIKVLQKEKIPIDIITGSSAGALVGALFSRLGDIEEVERIMLQNDWRKAISMLSRSPRKGIISAKKSQKFLEEIIGEVDFKDLSIPLGVVATDFSTGKRVSFTSGKVSKAIHASAAFPLFIEPLSFKGRTLWDGGMSDPVPVELARDMGAEVVIAVNLYGKMKEEDFSKKTGVYDLLMRGVKSLQYHLSEWKSQDADIIIKPDLDEGVLSLRKFFQKNQGIDIIKEGERAAKKEIKGIRNVK